MKLIYTLFIAVTISLVFFVGTSEQAQDCAGIENGNSTYDGCGVCNGKNNTCGGCDGKGNQIDICGVCDGDNSTCTCVIYHGYHINELDYILLQEAINETLLSVDCLIDLLDAILVKLQCLDVDHLDIASVIKIICMFMRKNLEPYSDNLDDLIAELDKSFGLPSDFQSFLNTQTNDNFYKWIDSVTNY